MADIALRNYLEEIDRMIDGNQVDEAVAHAKYVLGIYPKNLEAYKLLAKCLLEKNRHMDAADIFQRVLSAVPDDFVSHIGMSIAREDESNLDAAIWHMERAFEVQPSSGPVQEELKRLHGKREGMEPPKVRLTRGALARLYQKGHHYQQAIAELQAAIKEEPDRYDLRVLLAQALWHANRLEEAKEVCNKILEILPFCREANRILVLIWEGSGREAEAKTYRKRLEALDPYEAYSNLQENGSGAGKVPADNVHIPRLDYVPSVHAEVQDTSRPGWMQSVGVKFDQPQTSTEAPDWLSGLNISGAPAEAAPVAESPAPTTTPADDDWINTFTSGAPGAAVEEPAAPAQDALPDWLGASGAAAPEPQAEAPAQEDWLNTLGATPEPQKQSGSGWLREIEERKHREAAAASAPIAEAPAAESTPSWMDQPAAPAEAVPDWLKNMTESQMAQGGTSDFPPAPVPTDDVQSWLSGAATTPAESQPSATGELPDWLKGSAPETPVSSAGEEVPDWLKSMTGSPSEPAPQAAASSTGELPDWLKGSAEPQPASETPAWLKEEATPAPPSQAAAPQPAQPESGGEEIPDFMKQMGWTLRDPSKPLEEPNVFAEEPIAAETPSEEAAPAQLPDWLQSLKPQQEEAKLQASGEAPDWLRSAIEGEAAPVAPTAEAAAPMPTPQETSAMPASEDEALAWLESLAARQGAPSDELVSTPQARKTVSTDWLRQPIAEEAPDKPSTPVEEAVPEWLRPPAEEESKDQAMQVGVPPTTRQPTAANAPASEEDALAWLESLAARQGAPADELVSSAKGSAVETPDWLKGTTTEEPATPVLEEKPEPSLADWLKQDQEEEKPVAPPQDEIPDWLKEPTPAPGDTIVAFLKDKQTSSLPPKPLSLEESARISKIGTPDWATQLSEQEGEVPAPRISTIGSSPEWLSELSGEPSAAEQTTPAQEPSLDDWLKEGREEEQPPATTTPPSTDEGDALAWLESLAARQGAKADELVSSVEARTTETPDWVKKSAAEEKPFTPAKSEPPEEKPAWLRQMEAESDYYEASRTAPTKPPPETPEWLKPLEEEAPPVPADDSLDWLKPPQKETTPATPPSTSATPQGEEDALAWLESLAERQGAKSDELVSNVKDRDLETPEWVKQSAIQEPPAPTPPAGDKSDWLKQMEAESDAYEATLSKPTAKPEEPAEEEIPEWLRALPPSTSPGDSVAAFLKDKPATSALRPLGEVAPQGARATARIETPSRPVTPPFEPVPPIRKTPSTPVKAEPPAPRPARPKRIRKAKVRRADQPAPEVVLGNARAHLTESNFGDAIAEYSELIRSGESLTDVIADLEKATQQNPNAPELMRTLGDAYMKDGQLQRSLDIYRQALKTL